MGVKFVLPPELINKVYRPHLFAQERTQIFFGGSSSGKSYFLAERCITDLLEGKNYLIVRNVETTLRKSTFNEIQKAITKLEVNKYFNVNKSSMTITCNLNNRQILFCGLDDVDKLKSITPAVGVIHVIWIEEATEISYKAYKQLCKRLRGKSKFKKRIQLSFNPILKTHWIFREFFAGWRDDKTLLKSDDLLILKTTYKDNAFLEPDDIKALEDETDKYFYEVYTLGNWGILGAVIFTNWQTADLSTLIPFFDKTSNGLDFGFAKDPSVIIRSHLDKVNKKIYIYDCHYETGLTNDILAVKIREKIKDQVIYCDCAEPKSIRELQKYKVSAVAVKKGPDSKLFGIQWLQQYEIIVDYRCQDFVNELSQYKWKEDKDGNILPIPVDKFDHGIDSLRYSWEDEYLINDEDEDDPDKYTGNFEGI